VRRIPVRVYEKKFFLCDNLVTKFVPQRIAPLGRVGGLPDKTFLKQTEKNGIGGRGNARSG
jgi:hypothetical protein